MKLLPIAPEPSMPAEPAPVTIWKRFLGEPLLHFVVVGAVLFGSYSFLAPKTVESVDTRRVELTRDDVRQLANGAPNNMAHLVWIAILGFINDKE
ncbi:hypothetical protein [Pararhizobium sp. PWRC1-1]|uniref:hypothetical protein n=1 Tax=Pararhizobium sp. PWRC1-1 TaxID=2804566 RepID=UPI003CFB8B52